MKRAMRTFTLMAVAVLAATAMNGQTFEIFHSFSGAKGEPEAGLIRGSDGRLYGTAKTGGDFGRGSVYALAPDLLGGYTFAELHAFAGADGAYPTAPLIQAADGGFYGTTSEGGLAGVGTVFFMDAEGRVTTLHSFTGAPQEGAKPFAGLIQAPDGFLYGTTLEGGGAGLGTVFRLTTSGDFVTLHSFSGQPVDGAKPYAELLRAPDGRFYGTTSEGGLDGAGTVYRIDPAGNFATVADLDYDAGAFPQAGLVRASNGYFYGVTPFGGANSGGTVFRVGYLGGLALVEDLAFNGEARTTLIQASDGKLYGTTIGNAVVFRIDPSGANFEVVHDFTPGFGSEFPWARLLELPDGRLAGALSNGLIYALDAFGGLDELYRLRATDGQGPLGGLVEGTGGDLYGTTTAGGEFGGWGTVFRISLAGDLTILHSFNGSDGFGPSVRLLESGGFFYGTTAYPGSGPSGSLFKIDSDGAFSALHFFSGSDGADPQSPLIEGDDGAFYATTISGGPTFFGTAYRIDPPAP